MVCNRNCAVTSFEYKFQLKTPFDIISPQEIFFPSDIFSLHPLLRNLDVIRIFETNFFW